jgi:16S rRNA (cytosine1402-N4)-methyltransferase
VTCFEHTPVLEAEVLKALRPHSSGLYVDGTVGAGGHAAAILRASAPTGRLLGCDRDIAAVSAAREKLADYAGRFDIRQGNFADLTEWIERESCDGALLDLGVSSPQLDQAERGFSFQQDGPLDMRMDRRQELTAADLVNTASAGELSRIFWELGEEPRAKRLAREVETARKAHPFRTTLQLARLVERICPRRPGQRVHPATRVFQALRMAVNDEIGALQRGLEASWAVLKRGGRLLVITFHSLEARMVKDFGRALARDYEVIGTVDLPEFRRPASPRLRYVERKAIQAERMEIETNPRARSAQLRVFEKL